MNHSSCLTSLNPLADELNQQIEKENSTVFHLLSAKGKALFFPKGILSQSAEAKNKAYKYNATIGIATSNNRPLVFPSISQFFNKNLLNTNEIFDYTSSYGHPELRELWQKRIMELTPSLKNALISRPLVTCGLTHGLSTVAEMFFNAGDTLLLPNQIWGNYRLIFNIKNNVKIKFYNFFKKARFDFDSFKKSIQLQLTDKNKTVKLLLNFPNNPTGYSIYREEAQKIVEYLTFIAEQGNKILVILDDAYFGLYYDDDVYPESLLGLLSNSHENLLVIKSCGITKEFFAWGLRIGFLTYGCKNASAKLYECLEKKTAGAIRGNVSNLFTAGQNIVLKVLKNFSSYQKNFQKNFQILAERGIEVKKVLSTKDYSSQFIAYPFNAGYFMLVKLRKDLDAEQVRVKLLQEKGIGVISTSQSDIRIAFSCLNTEDIKEVFDNLFEICQFF